MSKLPLPSHNIDILLLSIFHYCEQTRTRVIPCVAKSLNITLGPTAYDKGAFLYSCPYNKNKGSKKIMQ